MSECGLEHPELSQCEDVNPALSLPSGPYKYEREVVSHLNAGGALGTFFINGNNCESASPRAIFYLQLSYMSLICQSTVSMTKQMPYGKHSMRVTS